jgi:hypothetical protein
MARRRFDPDRRDGLAARIGDKKFHSGGLADIHFHGRHAQFEVERAAGGVDPPGDRDATEDEEHAQSDGDHDEFLDAEAEADDGEDAGTGGEQEAAERDHRTGPSGAGSV